MENHELHHPDYGTGEKKLGVYSLGLIICSVLTLLAFWVVMTHQYSKLTLFTVVYTAAIIQFFVQVICFLRLNTQTPQARTNVMSIVFTIVILITIVIGSLWIMGNLNINMM